MHDRNSIGNPIPDKTCESYFGVKDCSTCQKLIYLVPSFNGCNYVGVNNAGIYYENGLRPKLLKDLTEFCSKPCDELPVKNFTKTIVNQCESEINKALENGYYPGGINENKEPKTDEIKTGIEASNKLDQFYRMIPLKRSLCIKSSKNEFCTIELFNKTTEYVAGKTNKSSLKLNSPSWFFEWRRINPVTSIAQSNNISIPSLIGCDTCYQKIAAEYARWVIEMPIEKTQFKNFYIKDFQDLNNIKLQDNCDIPISIDTSTTYITTTNTTTTTITTNTVTTNTITVTSIPTTTTSITVTSIPTIVTSITITSTPTAIASITVTYSPTTTITVTSIPTTIISITVISTPTTTVTATISPPPPPPPPEEEEEEEEDTCEL
ncbi:hypothetical protein G9A89_009844 [Geosiphon pyriformis]|nr:hypothetical protein G9A89_009844 [Geosiphon pyriformis]